MKGAARREAALVAFETLTTTRAWVSLSKRADGPELTLEKVSPTENGMRSAGTHRNARSPSSNTNVVQPSAPSMRSTTVRAVPRGGAEVAKAGRTAQSLSRSRSSRTPERSALVRS